MPTPRRTTRRRTSDAEPSSPPAETAEHGHRATPANPLAEAVAQVGDRWALLVVDALLAGPQRFGELQEQIEGLAPNILSRRLKQLEADGLVIAEPYSQRPLRHAYRLTARGEELAGVLRLLAQWASSRRGTTPSEALTHQACGTTLEAVWYCPTCDQVVQENQTTDLHWL